MKKLMFTLAAVTVFMAAHAQLREGRMVLIANASYFNTTSGSEFTGVANNTRVTSDGGSIFPRFGYMFSDKIMAGLFGGYQYSNYTSRTMNNQQFNVSTQEQTSTSNLYSGGLFARFYRPLIKDGRLAAFIQLSAGVGTGTSKAEGTIVQNNIINKSNGETDIVSANLVLNPGLAFFINDWLAIEASFGSVAYNWQRNKEYSQHTYLSTQTDNNLNINLSSYSFNLGFNFYFGAKQGAATPNKG